jgi:hypothetical protein
MRHLSTIFVLAALCIGCGRSSTDSPGTSPRPQPRTASEPAKQNAEEPKPSSEPNNAKVETQDRAQATSLPSPAESAPVVEKICNRLNRAQDRAECLRDFRGKSIDLDVAEICDQQTYVPQRVDCLAAMIEKRFTQGAVEICKWNFQAAMERVECLQTVAQTTSAEKSASR